MKKIIHDISMEHMISTIDENHNTFYALVGEKAEGDLILQQDMMWIDNPLFSWPNFIFDTQIKSNSLEKRINYIVRKIVDKEAPPKWVVGPTNTPGNLRRILEDKGFAIYDKWIGMAMELRNLKGEPQTKKGLTIKEVEKQEELTQWIQVLASGSFNGKEIDETLLRNLFAEKLKVKLYLAFYDGKPVATSLAYYSPGIVGIYMVATRPDYRGKGLGKAVTLKSLVEAKNKGYNIAVLQSTQMAQSLYEKMGFKKYFDLYGYKLQSS